jgi:hypothetical protein
MKTRRVQRRVPRQKWGGYAFEYKAKLNRSGGKLELIHREQYDDLLRQGNPKVPKIYIVSRRKRIIYIGATTQRITDRMRQHLNSKNKPPWVSLRSFRDKELRLIVITLPKVYLGVSGKYKTVSTIEAIEAELVYRVRKKGSWPKGQIEIHFSPNGPTKLKVIPKIAGYLKNVVRITNISEDE